MGCFLYPKFRRVANSQCILQHDIQEMEIDEAHVFNDMLFLALIFGTRIALPITMTLALGFLLERVLRRDANSAASCAWR